MARSYTKLVVTISTDVDFIALSLPAKFVYVMLLSMPKVSPAGCIEYRPAKWSRMDRTFTESTISDAVDELSERGFVMRDDDTEEVFIRSFIKHDGGTRNSNMAKSVLSSIGLIESPRLRAAAHREFERAPKKGQVAHPEEHCSDTVGDTVIDPVHNPVGDTLSDTLGHLTAPTTTTTPSTAAAPGPKTGIPAADAAAFEDFDQAVNAAVAVRRSQTTTVTNEGGWAIAARRGIISDYGDRVRQLLTEGNSPVNAGRLALGAPPIGPRAAVADTSHRAECECGGSGWVPADEANDRRGGSVVACTIVQPELATVHTLRATS